MPDDRVFRVKRNELLIIEACYICTPGFAYCTPPITTGSVLAYLKF